ncbi:hypothetical protein IWZ00DRAFT_490710 [Phyllosticta capitalensis]
MEATWGVGGLSAAAICSTGYIYTEIQKRIWKRFCSCCDDVDDDDVETRVFDIEKGNVERDRVSKKMEEKLKKRNDFEEQLRAHKDETEQKLQAHKTEMALYPPGLLSPEHPATRTATQ